jgi:4-hydroxybenzoate polyprenyltransferase
MAGFIVNDVCDRPKDILACVQRPIAMGLISSAEGVVGSSLLFTMAFCVTPLLGRSVLILFFTAGAVVAYSTFARRFPILKGVYTALLCCAPLAYGAAIGGGEFAITVYAALICFICGREIYLDVRDVAGDSRFGLQTIPVLIGILAAKRMAIGLMIAGGLFTLIVVRSTTGYVAAASSLLLLGAVLTWPGIELHRRLELTRIPIFLGAIALASTVWIG